MSRVEERLRELGVELPEPPTSVANYVNAVRTGNLVYVAGGDGSVHALDLATGNETSGWPVTGVFDKNQEY